MRQASGRAKLRPQLRQSVGSLRHAAGRHERAPSPKCKLGDYFVSIDFFEVVSAAAAFGDKLNVSHTFQPSGRALLSNSP